MTTPTTLQAKLTGDVAGAQAAIQQLIGTVDQLGKTVNASSAIGQRAFKAEADEVRRLLETMGASERQMGRLETAVKGFDQRVATEQKAAASAADQLRNNYAAASKDVVSGLGEIATAGKVTSGSLRDLVQGAGEIALAFGPQSAFMGAIAVATASIVTLFVDARAQLEETQRAFAEKLETMRRDANVGGLRDAAIQQMEATQAARERAAAVQSVARAGGVGALLGGGLFGRLAGSVLSPVLVASANRDAQRAQAQFDASADALRNPGGGPRTGGMLPTVNVTADTDEKRRTEAAKKAREDGKKAAEDMKKLMADIQKDQMAAFGVNSDGSYGRLQMQSSTMASTREQLIELGKLQREMGVGSPETQVFSGIAESASAAVTPLQVLRADMAQTGAQLMEVGRIAGTSIPGAVAAGVDALVSGQGNALKAMKRAFAEPIVMHLKAKAIESFALAASYAGNPVMWPLIPAAIAGGAKNLAGAALVSRLGGLAGGGGGDVGGGGASTTPFGRGAGLSGAEASPSRADRPMRIEMVIVQQAPDGRELARSRQMLQRLEDRNQPIRVTL